MTRADRKDSDDRSTDEAASAAATLDALGLKCPLPALKTRQALERLGAGATLLVAADDPMAAIDIPHLVRERGDELLEAREEGGRLRFLIRKRKA